MGKNINLRKDGNLHILVSYELDKNAIFPRHYHKADCFKTEAERVTSRPKEWFISEKLNIKVTPNYDLPDEAVLDNLDQTQR